MQPDSAPIRPNIVAAAYEEERVIALVEAGLGAAILPEFDPSRRRVVLRNVQNLEVFRTIAASGSRRHVQAIQEAQSL